LCGELVQERRCKVEERDKELAEDIVNCLGLKNNLSGSRGGLSPCHSKTSSGSLVSIKRPNGGGGKNNQVKEVFEEINFDNAILRSGGASNWAGGTTSSFLEVENQIVVKLKNKEVTILAMENDKKAFENNLISEVSNILKSKRSKRKEGEALKKLISAQGPFRKCSRLSQVVCGGFAGHQIR
jgi:hypothetical protein